MYDLVPSRHVANSVTVDPVDTWWRNMATYVQVDMLFMSI